MNEVVQQWIVRKKQWFIGDTWRLMVKLKNGEYYYSNGEIGDFSKIDEDSAREMIKEKLQSNRW